MLDSDVIQIANLLGLKIEITTLIGTDVKIAVEIMALNMIIAPKLKV